jgi:ankyrin repeat protein
LPLLKLLLKLGADPKVANVDGLTPLLAAAGVGALNSGDELPGTEEEAIEAVQMQLELGADINTVDKNKETAIHGAVYQEWPKVVQYLADHGAKSEVWHQKNRWGWTPHMIALGNRPGNFRPSPQTIVAIEKLMRAGGIDPAKTVVEENRPQY